MNVTGRVFIIFNSEILVAKNFSGSIKKKNMDTLNKVKLNFITAIDTSKPENCENFVYWPASQPPPNPEFKFEKFQNRTKLLAKDTILFESFNDNTNDDFNYFAATIDPNNSGRLVCKPAKLYRMLPNYVNLLDAENADESIRLTKREQMDELKGKFGSKKTQRDLGGFTFFPSANWILILFLKCFS